MILHLKANESWFLILVLFEFPISQNQVGNTSKTKESQVTNICGLILTYLDKCILSIDIFIPLCSNICKHMNKTKKKDSIPRNSFPEQNRVHAY